jgi:glycosyltransferase involved in cell wall biosynthesis
MKTINIINLNLIIGGKEIYLLNLIKELRKDYKISFFTKIDVWKNTELLKLENIKIYDIKSISYKDFFKIKKFIVNNSSSKDIFIFNGNRAIYLGAFFPYNYKKIAIQHSSLYDIQDGYIKKYLRILIYKIILFNYDRLIGISKYSVFPIINNKKVEVILNGINFEKFYNCKKSKNKEYINILMVGILNDNKGQYEALEILKYLDKKFRLIIVGDGEDREKIEKYIQNNNLKNRVILTGKINNVIDYYSQADILLFMSKNEGLPLTILEAMACGIPVLTTNVGGIGEIIKNNVNGIFINRNNKKEIADIIKKVIENDELKLTLIRNAYNLVRNDLNLKNHVEQFKSLIERCYK